MVKIKGMRNGNGIRVIGVITIIIFARMSSASNGNDILLTQAKQICGLLPKVVGLDKNPITPEKIISCGQQSI